MLGAKFGVGSRPWDLRRKGGGTAGLKVGGKVGLVGGGAGLEVGGGGGMVGGAGLDLGEGLVGGLGEDLA